MENRTLKNVGGTRGGGGEFLLGLGLLIAGGYLLMQNVIVTTGFWQLWGFSPFGLTLIPMSIGIGLLFYGKKIAGWLLTGGGLLIIVVGVIAGLHIVFKPTSLFNTILMLGLMASGVGILAKSLRDHPEKKE